MLPCLLLEGRLEEAATYLWGDGCSERSLGRCMMKGSVHIYSPSSPARHMEDQIRSISKGDGSLTVVLYPGTLFSFSISVLSLHAHTWNLAFSSWTILLVNWLLILTSATLVFDGEELKFSTAKPVGRWCEIGFCPMFTTTSDPCQSGPQNNNMSL